MPWGPDVETNLAISSANHLKVRFIQQSPLYPDIYKDKNNEKGINDEKIYCQNSGSGCTFFVGHWPKLGIGE
ncbi:hypothetical protein E3U36_01440 [Arsenophonus endosymbiont of Aphis craccivora]|uniref:hypothetical protein n=1 Tax=Arsenophonus endosymbiont of Aphis craccivora TaxID=1231049 RepID=UPI0015DCC03B|nr:hypothetical protein [Arsenophonus endosymbiont of Aphis craccivora]QLK87176.1 hypothetical protein E3U36_01440 [Arsenophonus endosymbiont of Aphis craccivora]